MQIVNFSQNPRDPCILLQWPNSSILLDCSLDYSPLFSYIPHVYQSTRLKGLNPSRKFNISYLKEIGSKIYVEGVPEICHVSLDLLDIENIDAILISNSDSLLALPFYTEGTGFKGRIYMTELTFQFGKLLMEEMIEYMERIDFSKIDNQWKKEDICGKFPNIPSVNPLQWRPFYGSKEMNSCLSKITTLSFNQTVDILRIEVMPICSGYSLGSSNWTIKTENEKLAFMSASSDIKTHVKKMDKTPIRTCDYLLLSSLCTLIDFTPQSMGSSLIQNVTDTLKRGGNVLFPINPCGSIWEMIEVVSSVIDGTPGISLDTPIYFISPVAKSVIAMASISAEWMSEERQNAVYRPEEPFSHSHLIRSGRLKIYDSLYGTFSKEYKTPCVMFTGHPSLRIGDAAHMIEVWGQDSRNAVILTDQNLNVEEVREPFKGLPIRFLNCPMDFRLNFKSINDMLNDVKPKYLITPSEYQKPMVAGRIDLMIQYGLGNVTTLPHEEPILTAMLSKTKQKSVTVKIHPEVLKGLKFKQHPKKSNIAIASVNCHLSCYDDDFQLLPTKSNRVVPKRKYGRLTLSKLLAALQEKKLETEVCNEIDNRVVKIPSLESTIVIMGIGNRIKILAPNAERRKQLLNIVSSVLVEDDGIVGRNLDRKIMAC